MCKAVIPVRDGAKGGDSMEGWTQGVSDVTAAMVLDASGSLLT